KFLSEKTAIFQQNQRFISLTANTLTSSQQLLYIKKSVKSVVKYNIVTHYSGTVYILMGCRKQT
ncbi:hypothetical protein, partial [Salmonella sp. s55004]|uniref:hypothetical protein n=1 Tax=Salmonella sp. s55004 TaxID=3159675 RepID=UPI003980167D